MPRSDSLIGITLRAVTIAALGVVIGLVDSSIRGPVKTKLDAPPPLPTPTGTGPGGGAPSQPTNPPTAPAPGDTTPTKPAPAGTDDPNTAPPAAPTAQTPPAPSDQADWPQGHITVAQAKAEFDKQGQFVDSRKKEEYEAGHVQGAIRMELSDFKDAIPPSIEFLDKSKSVIVYCVGGHCDESEAVGKQLNLLGFKNVYVMHDGFPGWKSAGHPVETGPGQW